MSLLRKTLFLLLTIISISLAHADDRTWQIPNDMNTIREMKLDLNSWKGKFVGFEGVITRIEAGYENTPVFSLQVGDKKKSEEIWIGSLFKGEFSIGDKIRIFGLMTDIRERDVIMKQFTSDRFFVMGICVIIGEKEYAAGEERWKNYCNEWFFKGFPKAPR